MPFSNYRKYHDHHNAGRNAVYYFLLVSLWTATPQFFSGCCINRNHQRPTKEKKNKFLQISMSTVKQKKTSININLWGVKNEDDTNSQQSSWLHHVAPNRLDDVSIVMYAKEIELREMIITFEWKEHTHMYTQIEHRTTNWPDDHARNIN